MIDRAELTESERSGLTPEERELVEFFESVHDLAGDDRRFGDLPYDDVLNKYGRPMFTR